MHKKLPVHSFTLFYEFLDKYIEMDQPKAILYKTSTSLKLFSGFDLANLENMFLTTIELPITLRDFQRNNFKADNGLNNFIENLPRNLYENVKILTRKNIGQTFEIDLYSLVDGLNGVEFIKNPRNFPNRYIQDSKMYMETYSKRTELPLISDENFVSLVFCIDDNTPFFKQITPLRRSDYFLNEISTAIRLSQNSKIIQYAADKKFNFLFEPENKPFSEIEFDDKTKEIFNLEVDYESNGIRISAEGGNSNTTNPIFALISYNNKTLVADKSLFKKTTKKYRVDLSSTINNNVYGSRNRVCFYSLSELDSLEDPIEVYNQIEDDVCAEIDMFFDNADSILKVIEKTTKDAGEYSRIEESYRFLSNYFEMPFTELEIRFKESFNKDITSLYDIPSVLEKEKILGKLVHDSRYFTKLENKYKKMHGINNIYWHLDSIGFDAGTRKTSCIQKIIIADDNSKTAWLNKIKRYLGSKDDLGSNERWILIRPAGVIETMKLKRVLNERPFVYLLSKLDIPKEEKVIKTSKAFQVVSTVYEKNYFSNDIFKKPVFLQSSNNMEEQLQKLVFIPVIQSKNTMYINGEEMFISDSAELEISQYQKIFKKLYNVELAVAPKTHINKMKKEGFNPILIDNFINQERSEFTWEKLKPHFNFAQMEILFKLENINRYLVEPLLYSDLNVFDTGVLYKVLNLLPDSLKNTMMYISEHSSNMKADSLQKIGLMQNIYENHLQPELFTGLLFSDLAADSFDGSLYSNELNLDIKELNQNLNFYKDIIIWDLVKYLQQRSNALAGFYLKSKITDSEDRQPFIPEHALTCFNHQIKHNKSGFIYLDNNCRSDIDVPVGITAAGKQLQDWFEKAELTEYQRTTINLLDQTYIRLLEPIVTELNLRRRRINET